MGKTQVIKELYGFLSSLAVNSERGSFFIKD